jgi:hypothetical protein
MHIASHSVGNDDINIRNLHRILLLQIIHFYTHHICISRTQAEPAYQGLTLLSPIKTPPTQCAVQSSQDVLIYWYGEEWWAARLLNIHIYNVSLQARIEH